MLESRTGTRCTARRMELRNAKLDELERLLQAHSNNEPVLQELLGALKGRTDPPARALRGKIITQIGALHAAAHKLGTHAPNGHQPENGAAGPAPRMRAPGTPGLPLPQPARTETHDNAPPQPLETSLPNRYITALEALITELRESPRRKRRDIENGRRMGDTDDSAVYAFELADQNGIRDDASVDIEIIGRRLEATVLSLQPGIIVLTVADDLGPSLRRAVLLLDDTKLLKDLCDKLRAADRKEFEFNRHLADIAVGTSSVLEPIAAIPYSAPQLKLNDSQAEARRRVLNQSVTFIWGPPGCGKTYTLSDLVRTVFEAGQRTLICSNTNKAVDQVLLGVCRALGAGHTALDEGRIVRLGAIADDKLNAEFKERISLDEIVERHSVALEIRMAELTHRRSALQQEIQSLNQLTDRLLSLDNTRAELSRLERDYQTGARSRAETLEQLSSCQSQITELNQKLQRAQGLLGVFYGNPERIRESLVAEERQRRYLEAQRTRLEAHIREVSKQHEELTLKFQLLDSELRDIDRYHLATRVAEVHHEEEQLGHEFKELEKELSDIKSSVIANARVLGTTGTRAYLSVEEIGPVDLVIVDEASMMLIPQVWFVAGMAQKRVVLCGDFRQLPPIISSSTPQVLAAIGDDIFHAARVSALNPSDPRIVMLDTQRRMDEAICQLISEPMYEGRLKTATDESFQKDRAARKRPPPPFDGALTLIDTSDLHPLQSFDGGSRFNMMHALLVRNLAWHFARSGYLTGREDLAVCTPYAAQTRLIRKLLEGESLSEVQVGTVHAFQGDERNAIILEFPESDGSASLGQFVTGVPPDDTGARLINVAVSRAQNHLLVIANLARLDELLPSRALLRDVLHRMEVNGHVVSGRELFALGPVEKDLQGLESTELSEIARTHGLFNEHDFDPAFVADVGRAEQSVAIFSGFVSHRRVGELIGLFGDKTQAGVKMRCISRPPHLNSRSSEVKRCLDALEGVGCAVDSRERIHQKIVIIDGRIVWHGSLNALSYAQRSEELMTRLVNAELARVMATILAKRRVHFTKALERIADAENPRCGDCGSRTFHQVRGKVDLFTCESQCGWSITLAELPSLGGNGLEESKSFDELPPNGAPCPDCGRDTLKRQSRYGAFYGCSHYPKCSGKWSLRDMPSVT